MWTLLCGLLARPELIGVTDMHRGTRQDDPGRVALAIWRHYDIDPLAGFACVLSTAVIRGGMTQAERSWIGWTDPLGPRHVVASGE